MGDGVVPRRRAARVFVGGVLGYLAVKYVVSGVIRIVVWRWRWKPALDVMRRYNRLALRLHPAAVEKAAKTATVVHHTGRRSGRSYATPVWGVRCGQSFFIQLPYGTDVDWCRNLLAAGGCALEHHGVRYEAVAPVIVPAAEARPHLPPATRRMQRLIGAESYLRLDISPGG